MTTLLSGNGGGGPVSASKGVETAAAAVSDVLGAGDGGGGGSVSEEFANRRRYDTEDERAEVIRSTMNAAKTKTSHIITSKKLPEQEQRLGPGGQLKLSGFVDKLKQYAQRNSSSRKKESQVSSALEEIKQRIKGPLSAAYEDDYGGGDEEDEWAAFDEPADDGRVEVVNLVFAPEAVEDGTAIKIFPDSELEKLKVTVADRAPFVNFITLKRRSYILHFDSIEIRTRA